MAEQNLGVFAYYRVVITDYNLIPYILPKYRSPRIFASATSAYGRLLQNHGEPLFLDGRRQGSQGEKSVGSQSF